MLQVLASNSRWQGCASRGPTWQRENLRVPVACSAKAHICKEELTSLHGTRSCAHTVSLVPALLSSCESVATNDSAAASGKQQHTQQSVPSAVFCVGSSRVEHKAERLSVGGVLAHSSATQLSRSCACVTQGAGPAGRRQLLISAQAVQAESGMHRGRQR